MRVRDEAFDTEDALEFQRARHEPVRGIGQVVLPVVEGFGAVQRQAVVDVYVVRGAGHEGDHRRLRQADVGEGAGEQARAREVHGDQAAFVLQREAPAVGGGVGFAGEQDLAVAFDIQQLALDQGVREALGLFQHQGVVVHARRGEQVKEGVLQAAAIQAALQRFLGEGGALDFGGGHRVDVGGEDDQGGEHPQRRDQHEALLAGRVHAGTRVLVRGMAATFGVMEARNVGGAWGVRDASSSSS